MAFFIPAAMAQEASGQQADPMSMFILFGGLFVFMYLFIFRPQKKRQKQHQELVAALSKGDEVVLNSGLLGKITKVDDNYVIVDAGNVELKFQKVSVHAVLPKGTIKSI